MTAETPILARYEGEGQFSPPNAAWARRADKEYVIGEIYRMAPIEDRSMRSHNHYFACVTEAWKNLPEQLAERFATPDHLRKWALIRAGYRNERSFACASKAEAVRLAAFLKPMDDYAIITVRDKVVIQYTAESQSYRVMGKQRFQESKDKVLDILAGLVKVESATLKANAGQAA